MTPACIQPFVSVTLGGLELDVMWNLLAPCLGIVTVTGSASQGAVCATEALAVRVAL